jgi:uncharacterized delta-60 repeat protein
MARYLVDGSLDPSFGISGIVVSTLTGSDNGNALALQSDGKILMSGSCPVQSPSAGMCVARYNTDGSFDLSFNSVGYVVTQVTPNEDRAQTVIAQPDGKIIAAGGCVVLNPISSSDHQVRAFCITRYNTDGSLDSSFGASGVQTTSVFVSTSTAQYTETARDVALQLDGKILLVGLCGEGYPARQFGCLVRYDATGVLDASFGVGGRLTLGTQFGSGNGRLQSVAIKSDGKILVAGGCGTTSVTLIFCVARLNSDGSYDSSFGNTGVVAINAGGANESEVSTVLLQPDGKVLLTGTCRTAAPSRLVFCLSRLNSDGALDTTFSADGTRLHIINSLDDRNGWGVLAPDGKIVMSGQCGTTTGNYEFCVARFRGGPYDAAACALNVDVNTVVNAVTDGLLITRYLLGFRGSALTDDAVGAGATRTGIALENYIAGLNLDADGDGQALPMTDGLLLTRAMLDVSATRLTPRATNTASPNIRTAKQIFTWIESTHGVACLP